MSKKKTFSAFKFQYMELTRSHLRSMLALPVKQMASLNSRPLIGLRENLDIFPSEQNFPGPKSFADAQRRNHPKSTSQSPWRLWEADMEPALPPFSLDKHF